MKLCRKISAPRSWVIAERRLTALCRSATPDLISERCLGLLSSTRRFLLVRMDPPRYGRPPSPLRAPSPLRVPAHPSTSVGSSFYSGEPSSLPTRGFYGGAQRSVGAQSPPCALYQPEWHPTGPFGHGYDGGYQQQQQRSFSTQVQPQPLHLPSRRSSLPLGGRVPAQPYARPPHARSTSFSQSPPSLSPLSLQDLYSPVSRPSPEPRPK